MSCTCSVCGKEFDASRSTAKFCSPKCKNTFHRSSGEDFQAQDSGPNLPVKSVPQPVGNEDQFAVMSPVKTDPPHPSASKGMSFLAELQGEKEEVYRPASVRKVTQWDDSTDSSRDLMKGRLRRMRSYRRWAVGEGLVSHVIDREFVLSRFSECPSAFTGDQGDLVDWILG